MGYLFCPIFFKILFITCAKNSIIIIKFKIHKFSILKFEL
jgi:hypothetical protein